MAGRQATDVAVTTCAFVILQPTKEDNTLRFPVPTDVEGVCSKISSVFGWRTEVGMHGRGRHPE
jgi:hypothetical protein